MDTILLTETEVASFLGKSTITLARWRREGYGPSFVRVGRSPRYQREALSDFMRANSIVPGGHTTT
ncbi:helix-turn-helix transcriptional regulator [Bradyrhizobium sp. SZCCHNPS2010]|uniref:helix-turn-helix transcriptional regulator n=1 Tax=Bradyrhizobium sp. SZCCHNPS2010 TaxID=3057333 RepID=UPI0039677C45